ncbi:MAG: adenylate/guanylate cyclase domain-containing protein [Mogibacterium diversum]|uniref:Adenylate/guanylate cyclase domain-containing protein n=1 Tax=Mogibacterium diversum TaxID=114527 RepID=A0A930EDS9_9FIRM|nr:adenylate/guanylate cyclase domain-containing protein [Mogibacterium diversum]
MKSNYKDYRFEDALRRLDEILNASDNSYEEKNEIPRRDRLTYTNGFYVNCTAVFVDIRGSSELPQIHRRPVLAKIYRSFISEVIAIFNGNYTCKEINVQGDGVWAIFDTPYQNDIMNVLHCCAQVNSLIDIINFKLAKKKYMTFKVGIGVDYGRALMIKAGYKGSTINDVIWMGGVVNQASNLCNFGNKGSIQPIVISSIIYRMLLTTKDEEWKEWFTFDGKHNFYHGNIINRGMGNWLKNQKRQY